MNTRLGQGRVARARRVRAWAGFVLCVAAAACASSGASPETRVLPDTVVLTEPAPAIPVFEVARGDTFALAPAGRDARDPFAGASDTRVTLTTSGADVRTLLVWLAQQANLDLVVSSDVAARVSVNFRDVRAVDALRAVLAEAGLSVLTGGPRAPWAPVVFYQLPVNVNRASAEVIAARFGVSLEVARFIVESRTQP